MLKPAAALSLGAVVAITVMSLAPGESTAPGSTPIPGSACTLPGLDTAHPGMVWVPGGGFTMGSSDSYFEEAPALETSVDGFWMDRTEITNAQYAEFVEATGYLTLAERGISDPSAPDQPPRAGSAVFVSPDPDNYDPYLSWWQFVDGANWRHPQGPDSNIEGLDQHPVVHIAFEDALAYARWRGNRLPSEAQFEYAAQHTGRIDAAGQHIANTWQGYFPYENTPEDGYTLTSPAGCYAANQFGLFDLIGNVWEWTSSPYYLGHDSPDRELYPAGYDPAQPFEEAVAVIKGGSHLCAANYCMRYTPQARQGQSLGLGTSHIGFRTVLMAPPPLINPPL